MSSYFQLARQTTDEEPEEVSPIFSQVKSAKQENIIPPVGIAKPELVESFIQNIGDEDKIRKDIEEVEAYERETLPQTLVREGLSYGARGLEGFFGGIGGFLNLLTPELALDPEGQPYKPGEQPQGLPSPSELREVTKHFTGRYLEPKGEKSKAAQETVSDIGSMYSTPGLGFWQKLLLPLGGQVVKQILKSSGESEKVQDIGKLGFMTLASMANLGNAQRVATNALREAEQMIPVGLSFSARPTENALNNIRNSQWYRTGATPSKAPAMAEIDRIQAQINRGMLDGHAAMQLRRDINEARRQLGGFQLNRPVNRTQALRYLDEVDNALLASMENYGTHVNPQWWRNYNLANEAFRITQRSRLISDLVGRYAKPLQSDIAKTLFHVGGASVLTHLPAVGATAVPVLGAAKTVQVMNRMIRSPVLRNHYLTVLRQASTGNAAATLKALESFDKEAKDLEKAKSQ